MLKAERASYIRQHLAELYPDPPIPLDHKDPYTCWSQFFFLPNARMSGLTELRPVYLPEQIPRRPCVI